MKANTDGNQREAVSSGGVVIRLFRGRPEILLLRDRRFPAWTLPKGHVQPGETLEQAAAREIREEAGVTSAKVSKLLGAARRYVERAKEWKTTHYFLIRTDPDQPKGNLESEFSEIRWFPLDELPTMYLTEQQQILDTHRTELGSIKD